MAVVLAVMLTACACADGLGKYQKLVSEYRDNVFVGESSGFTAEAVSGYREKPFEIDGVSNGKSDFCVVTITPKQYDPTAVYMYKTTLNEVEYEGEMVRHPFQDTYSFEIAARCNENNFVISIDDEQLELVSVKAEDFITPEKAFEIALKRLGNNGIIKEGRYEIYIRLIANPVNAAGGYFWYVAFVDENQETCAVLIEPLSMEITAVRD